MKFVHFIMQRKGKYYYRGIKNCIAFAFIAKGYKPYPTAQAAIEMADKLNKAFNE